QRTGTEWAYEDRLLALDAVGRLGDPRLLANPWVDIAGGEFIAGGDEAALQSLPAQEVRVASFRMCWRPVVVADFGRCFAAGGYQDKRWWQLPEAEEMRQHVQLPEAWTEQCFHPNRPVTRVSWFEAMAFCGWASAAGRAAFCLDEDWSMDLP